MTNIETTEANGTERSTFTDWAKDKLILRTIPGNNRAAFEASYGGDIESLVIELDRPQVEALIAHLTRWLEQGA